jgi:hypothetical protein
MENGVRAADRMGSYSYLATNGWWAVVNKSLRAPLAASGLKAPVVAAFCATGERARGLGRKFRERRRRDERLVRAAFSLFDGPSGREQQRVVNRCC